MEKWGSKITGVLVAGWGGVVIVARSGLGSGPNLSLTILYLTLLMQALHINLYLYRCTLSFTLGVTLVPPLLQVAAGYTLGARYNLLMDNTGGDNKNSTMVAFMGWLVFMDFFREAPTHLACHISHITCHISHVTCHVSRVTCHMPYVTCHMPYVTCHMSHVTCHMSHVTCHVSRVTLSRVTCHVSRVTCHITYVTCHMTPCSVY